LKGGNQGPFQRERGRKGRITPSGGEKISSGGKELKTGIPALPRERVFLFEGVFAAGAAGTRGKKRGAINTSLEHRGSH